MRYRYLHRSLEQEVRSAVEQFPAVLVTGARQAGKSTLLHATLDGHRYVTLDDPALRALARQDPRLFLSTYRPPVIIDEIQYAPELMPYLKLAIDEQRRTSGRFVLTGSQLFPLMQGVSESLAGRIAVLHLQPFHVDECPLSIRRTLHDEERLSDQIVRGFYPELVVNARLDRDRWMSSYLSTYLERDVRNIKRIGDLLKFQTFVGLLAGRAGCLLNLSELARDCGVSQPTAKEWLTILQATSIVHLLRPWHRNLSKRLIKAPKLYFIDTGLLCHLLGLDSGRRLLSSPDRGRIFENFVVVEVLKRLQGTARRSELFFYRTAAGVEVDLLVATGGALLACEIKMRKTPEHALAAGLRHSAGDLGYSRGLVLTLQAAPVPLSENIDSLNWYAGVRQLGQQEISATDAPPRRAASLRQRP